MATRIEALASFSNSDELDGIGGNIATGQTAVVGDEYAEELERSGLAEIVDTGVSGSEDSEENSEVQTSGEDAFEDTDYVETDGTLTEELPHHDVLADEGVETFSDLAAIEEDFQSVTGIGQAKAEDLSEAWDEIASN